MAGRKKNVSAPPKHLVPATKQDLDELQKELEQKLDQKATKQGLDKLQKELEQKLDQKATKQDLEELQKELEQKLDQKATKQDLEETKNELEKTLEQYLTRKYFDERLQQIDARFERERDEMRRYMAAALEGWASAITGSITKVLRDEFAQHIRSLQESWRGDIGAVDDKYADLPGRVAALEERR